MEQREPKNVQRNPQDPHQAPSQEIRQERRSGKDRRQHDNLKDRQRNRGS